VGDHIRETKATPRLKDVILMVRMTMNDIWDRSNALFSVTNCSAIAGVREPEDYASNRPWTPRVIQVFEFQTFSLLASFIFHSHRRSLSHWFTLGMKFALRVSSLTF
jgi:hypothetical protein